jgi:sigma-E factor negative regulatory protein RseC
MLEEQVIVTAVDGETAWVEAVAASSCAGCSQVCTSSLLQRHMGRKRAPLAARCRLAVAPGDKVVIGVEESALLWGSLLVYMLPLCVLLAGAAAALPLAAAVGIEADWPAALGGGLGLAAGIAALRWLPWLKAQAIQPVVLRKIPL